MDVTFHNVAIRLSNVKDADEAYDRLCNALGAGEQGGVLVDWETDTYEVDDAGTHRPVDELYPPEGSERERTGGPGAPKA